MGSDNLFHKRKERGAKELARRAAQKAPYETVLIICEGKETEVNYIHGLIKANRLNTANIEVMRSFKGTDPSNIVSFAIETAENREGIDRVFCVFDIDVPNYQLAINRIKRHKTGNKAKSKPQYQAILSSPCFEIWLLLHFTYSTKAYLSTGRGSACNNLKSELQKYIPYYTEGIDDLFKQTSPFLKTAIKNAKKLKIDNVKSGSTNPDTDLHILVEYLLKLESVINSTMMDITY